MQVIFKQTHEPVSSYVYAPIEGEICIEAANNYGALWTRDEQDILVSLTEGWQAQYYNINYIYELTDFEDITLGFLVNNDVLKYSSGQWVNGQYDFTSLQENFYDLNFSKYIVTSTAITTSSEVEVGQTFKVNSSEIIVNYSNRTTASQTPVSGSWSFFLSGIWYLRLHKTDSVGASATARLRNMISTGYNLTLNVAGQRYNVVVTSVTDLLDAAGSYLQLGLATNLLSSNIPFASNIGTGTLQISNIRSIGLTNLQPVIALPDAGNFDGSTQPVPALAPDGGVLKDKLGYLYPTFSGLGFTPDSSGEYSVVSTYYLRIYKESIELEAFNVNDFGGLGNPIPAPGMKIVIYGNAYAGTHTLTSSGGTATWTFTSNYYQMQMTQNIGTLLNGSKGIQIIRPNGPFHQWVL